MVVVTTGLGGEGVGVATETVVGGGVTPTVAVGIVTGTVVGRVVGTVVVRGSGTVVGTVTVVTGTVAVVTGVVSVVLSGRVIVPSSGVLGRPVANTFAAKNPATATQVKPTIALHIALFTDPGRTPRPVPAICLPSIAVMHIWPDL